MATKAKLTKSSNKQIAGVCAGIAEYLGWEVTVTRIAYIVLTLCTAFAGIFVYLLMALVMPQPEE